MIWASKFQYLIFLPDTISSQECENLRVLDHLSFEYLKLKKIPLFLAKAVMFNRKKEHFYF